ncbi:MAG: MFS transporter [Acidimicrobiales bacterium]
MTSTAALRVSAPGPVVRQARTAVGALFLTNGALVANLLPRYPQIKADLGISNVGYGLAIAAFPAGAMVAGLAAGALIRRFGSARVAVAGTIATSVLVLIAGTAPVVAVFVAALFVAGAMDAITDVAQNAHGLEVQRRYGRSIINSFHATWSVGAVVGGSMAAGAIALGLPRGVHLAISAVLFSTVALVALRFCLPHAATTPSGDGSHASPPLHASSGVSAHTIALLAALVLIALAGAVVEDAGMSWAAIYLSGSLDASATLAAAGYVTLVGAQFVGRLVGDRLVDRFGERAVARTGGLITASGMSIALAVPSVPTTILGFAAAGFGVATLVPAAMHQADQLPGLKPGAGLTIVAWLMRLGFLLAPPLVGWIADNVSLRAGLLVVPAAGLTVMVLASVLPPRRDSS